MDSKIEWEWEEQEALGLNQWVWEHLLLVQLVWDQVVEVSPMEWHLKEEHSLVHPQEDLIIHLEQELAKHNLLSEEQEVLNSQVYFNLELPLNLEELEVVLVEEECLEALLLMTHMPI